MARFFTLLIAAIIVAAVPAPAEDLTAKYGGDDLSVLFDPAEDFLGFIGADYQRLFITLTSYRQDAKDKRVYHVTGWSKVKGNKCDFSGEIVVTSITAGPPGTRYSAAYNDDVPEMSVRLGQATGRYEFRENPEQPHSGVFAGKLTIGFVITENGKLFYQQVFTPKRGRENNKYIGTWTSCATKTVKPANWGDRRIDESGDLDVGKNMFTVNTKYKKNGWEDYITYEDRAAGNAP